jgi:hypothetical protein
MHSDTKTDDPELTDITWVGESVAENLASIGITESRDLLYADKYRLADLPRLGVEKAEMIIDNAHKAFDEAWYDKQFDPSTQLYYDAGPTQFACVCDRTFDEETTYRVHVKRCTTAGGDPPIYQDFSVEVVDEDGTEIAQVYGDGDHQSGYPVISFSPDQVEALVEFFLLRYDLDHLFPDPDPDSESEPETDVDPLSSDTTESSA